MSWLWHFFKQHRLLRDAGHEVVPAFAMLIPAQLTDLWSVCIPQSRKTTADEMRANEFDSVRK